MTIRILADREPYASLATPPIADGEFVLMNGPAGVDEPEPDVIVLPAADFRELAIDDAGGGPGYIAYGPVSAMGAAFALGCLDYLREPWTLPELYARLGKQLRLRFKSGESILRLRGNRLECGSDWIELCPAEITILRFLVRNAPFPVIKGSFGMDADQLAKSANALRRKLDILLPELGVKLHAVRGLGYRFDVSTCG